MAIINVIDPSTGFVQARYHRIAEALADAIVQVRGGYDALELQDDETNERLAFVYHRAGQIRVERETA